MKVVIAPDSFKESMNARQVASAMERGVKNVCPDCMIVTVPLADGGEGTAHLLIEQLGATMIETSVTGPLGDQINVSYGLLDGHTAIMDVATVVGLHLVPQEKRNPLLTTSFGIGELIRHALDQHVTTFIIGLGGSSTNDGGIGMMQALGANILDAHGKVVPRGGKGLIKIDSISLDKLDQRLQKCRFIIVTDVDSPLLGKSGATYVYGKQKGANDEMIKQLESAMNRFAQLLKRITKCDITTMQGAGAAGGLGAMFAACLRGKIKRGIDYMLELMELEKEIKGATLVITGEGKLDDQTLNGKVVMGVTALAKKYHVPVVAIVGANKVKTRAIYDAGLTAVFPIVNKPMSLADALISAQQLTEKTVENIFRLVSKVNH